MKLQQLRYVYVVAQRELNVSEAASALHTSQPGVSKQIRLLEQELGIPIFVRSGKRLVAVTEPGNTVIAAAQRILSEVDNLKKVGSEYRGTGQGTLSIATTHTQARYALPSVLSQFRTKYPNVMVRIHQGSPAQIVEMVRSGDADLAIATEAVGECDDLVSMPCYQWNRCVVVPQRHPLLRLKRKLTLEDIAKYPLITYDFAFAGRSRTHRAFADRGLTPNVVLTAIDADIIKTYVRLGMGVGLMAAMAFDAKSDKPLHSVDAGHLFEASTTWVGMKKGSFLRGYTIDFISAFAPHLTRSAIDRALRGDPV